MFINLNLWGEVLGQRMSKLEISKKLGLMQVIFFLKALKSPKSAIFKYVAQG